MIYSREPGFTVAAATPRMGVIARFAITNRAAEYQRAIAEFMRAIAAPEAERLCITHTKGRFECCPPTKAT